MDRIPFPAPTSNQRGDQSKYLFPRRDYDYGPMMTLSAQSIRKSQHLYPSWHHEMLTSEALFGIGKYRLLIRRCPYTILQHLCLVSQKGIIGEILSLISVIYRRCWHIVRVRELVVKGRGCSSEFWRRGTPPRLIWEIRCTDIEKIRALCSQQRQLQDKPSCRGEETTQL